MWKRVQVAGFVILFILASGVWFAGSSQDETDVRLQALEARVSNLEATVNALNGGGAAPSLDALVLTGELRLVGDQGHAWDYSGLPASKQCGGVGAYNDVHGNAMIKIANETRVVIAEADIISTTTTSNGCLLTFAATVPDADIYIVEIIPGDEVAYTRQHLDEQDWHVSITRVFR